MTDPDRPALRSDLEVMLVELEGEPLLVVRDPEMLAVDVAHFGADVREVMLLLDGEHTLEDIQVAFAQKGEGIVQREQLEGLLGLLDHYLLLDNENVRNEREERAAFLASPVRPAAHAGIAYPEESDLARIFLQRLIDRAPRADPAPLRRLIVPHIDLALGAEIHASAHQRLKSSGRPDVVVVLGVRHEPGPQRFVACRKDFDTPRARVRHDARILDALERRLGRDLTEGQMAHRSEHSVEFQALWLAHHWPEDPPLLVPILIGSFADLIERRGSPSGDEEVERFIRALRETLHEDGRRVVLLASVDLAHVGPMYEDEEGLDAEGERKLESSDRVLLDRILAGDAEGFFEQIAVDGNARHVCGTAPIYLTLRLGDGPGDLLQYGQGRIHPDSGSVVSYAAVAFP